MTALIEAVRAATGRLQAAGVRSARSDAEQLAAHVLGVRRGSLAGLSVLDPVASQVYADLVARRGARVPLQHLTGTVGFRYLDVAVGPGVFVPRPETESVVQWAVDALAVGGPPVPVVVDLGTGSGAIALALATEVRGARVHAVERDPVALTWAGLNVARYARDGGRAVTLHFGDMGDMGDTGDVPVELAGTVDLVVSNPPYLTGVELSDCDPEVRDHDPRAALVAGADGLDGVRLVAAAARGLLRPGGLVVVEHGDHQGASAAAVFTAAGCWDDVMDHRDRAGRDRFVTARRRADAGRSS